MLVTIGMPVYNRPIELERALNAVLSQTYTNIEIVISNNSSTDVRVDELVKRYLQTDNRVKYYFQKTPLPVIKNFKFVLEKASGDYFMWLADDDWIDANYVEECLSFLSKNPDYNLACGECAYHDIAGNLIDKFKMPSINSTHPAKRVIEYYKHVKLNGYFYGLRKTSLSSEFPLQNKMAFDWIYMAAIIYRGKAKVFKSTLMHITAGGISNDATELNRNMGSNNFFTRNFIGLTSSANAAVDIFKHGFYPLNFFSKIIFSIRIFFTVLSKTFMWDVIHVKRFFFGIRGNKK
jgi:glycosyltransferase involved in cell wall biosynthesis